MNPRNQLEWLSYLLGTDRKDVQGLLRAAALDSEMRPTVAIFLRARLIKEGGDPDDPASLPLVKQLPPGLMRIGSVRNGRTDGPIFAVPEGTSSDVQHVGVFGETRSGKSYILLHMARQKMESGGRCWIFDTEDEYATLVSAVSGPSRPIPLRPRYLRINFFQPPCDSIGPKTWLNDLSLVLRQEMFIRDGSLNLFGAEMISLMKSKGVFSGSAQYPSLAEVLQRFTNLKFGSSKVRSNTWLESLINRLTMLYDTFQETAHVISSDMLEQLANRSVIFRLGGLRGIPLQFLADFLLLWLCRYKEEQQE